MKQRIWLTLASILLLLIFLLVTMPARLPMSLVQGALPSDAPVRWQGVSGTIWQGEISQLQLDSLQLTDVGWQVRPWSLLTGKLVVELQIPRRASNYIQGRGLVRLGTNSLVIEQLLLDGQVDKLASLSPIPSPFPLRGQLLVNIQQFELGRPLCQQAQGGLSVQQVGIQVGRSWQSLGRYDADLTCEDGELQLDLDDSNLLGLSVRARANLQSTLLNFQLDPGDQLPPELADIVRLLPPQARQPQSLRLRYQ